MAFRNAGRSMLPQAPAGPGLLGLSGQQTRNPIPGGGISYSGPMPTAYSSGQSLGGAMPGMGMPAPQTVGRPAPTGMGMGGMSGMGMPPPGMPPQNPQPSGLGMPQRGLGLQSGGVSMAPQSMPNMGGMGMQSSAGLGMNQGRPSPLGQPSMGQPSMAMPPVQPGMGMTPTGPQAGVMPDSSQGNVRKVANALKSGW